MPSVEPNSIMATRALRDERKKSALTAFHGQAFCERPEAFWIRQLVSWRTV